MPRKTLESIREYTTGSIREYTTRKKYKTWLPSTNGIGSEQFTNTFYFDGKNADGTTSKGEINTLTDVDSSKPGPSGIINKNIQEPDNLNRLYLFLYCLENDPYFFNNVDLVINNDQKGNILTNDLSTFLTEYQTGLGKNSQTRSLTADVVRYYRGKKFSGEIESEKDIQKLITFSQDSQDYKKNVAGVLGRVTYDSVIKHTLYSLLKKTNILKQEYEKNSKIWSDEAQKLSNNEYGFYVDKDGGTYSRAFPVVCVYTKNKSGLSYGEIQQDASKFLSAIFFRSVSEKQLVKTINDNSDKNILEKKIGQNSGDSVYCVLYDLIEIMVLPTDQSSNYTLDILKIALSFFSRKKIIFKDKEDFRSRFLSLKRYLELEYNEILDKKQFAVKYKNKHTKEVAYNTSRQEASINKNLSNPVVIELNLLLQSLEDSYEKIISIFDSETNSESGNFQFKNYSNNVNKSIILHFDNFYNLLSVTSKNTAPVITEKAYGENIPFDLEEYDYVPGDSDLVEKFFNYKKELPKISSANEIVDYSFDKTIALEEDIVLVTDLFLRQVYENLSSSGKGFIYDTDLNQKEDGVILSNSILLLNLIEERTGLALKAEDYFILSSGKTFLTKDIVRKLELENLSLNFIGVSESKANFQTLGHILFLTVESLKEKASTINEFLEKIYYPLLIEKISASKTPVATPKPEQPVNAKEKIKNDNKNYLVNNIISSELNCYEDISNAFDKAINTEKTEDKIYYAFQALAYIGLPVLLTLSAQAIANRISQLKKNGDNIDPSLLDCLLLDKDKFLKNLITYSDLISNLDNPEELLAYLTQGYIELPTFPDIPLLLTFDSEKELKRKLLESLINLLLEQLGKKLKISMRTLIDMCNSDSYLENFVSTAFGNGQQDESFSGSKNSVPKPSTTFFIPSLKVNLNVLIDQSRIITREIFYDRFREKYTKQISNERISLFLDMLSDSMDVSQVVSLLRSSSTLELRNMIVSYVKNYEDGYFYLYINSENSVSGFFEFLSLYVDYALCYGVLEDQLDKYAKSICEGVSQYDDNLLSFGEISIEEELNDLTTSLDEICKAKNPILFDVFSDGPLFLTNKLKSALNIGMEQNVNSFMTSQKTILEKLQIDFIEDPISNNLKTDNIKDIIEDPDKLYKVISDFIVYDPKILINPFKNKKIGTKERFANYMLGLVNDAKINTNQSLSGVVVSEGDKVSFFKSLFNIEERSVKYKKGFNEKLNNSGNSALKTSPASIEGYVRKLQKMAEEKSIIKV